MEKLIETQEKLIMAIAYTNVSLQQQHQHQNPYLESLFQKNQNHNFIMDMERGPRYKAYSELREKKLLMKYIRLQQEQEYERMVEPKLATPPRKQVRFQGGLASGRKGSSSYSALAQSVPDFTAVLRKENKKPVVNMLPSVMELTPPSLKKGSVSASGAGEKRRVLMARKSYASIDELKSFSKATASAINGTENRGGGRSSRVMAKTGFGYRQF